MSESFNSKMIIFPAGEQRAFIELVMKSSGESCDQLASLVGVSGRTIRDWRREKVKMSLMGAQKLSRFIKITMPKDLKIQGRYAHLREAGKMGGRAIIAKYGVVGGDQQKRKIAWRRWWEEKGKYLPSKILMRRKLLKYPLHSNKLAEFVGILMGDGGISARQVVVTLHSETDKEFAHYYSNLCFDLFGIRPHLVKIRRAKAVNLIISRTDLVEFCYHHGLPIGHKIKQGLDVPIWIKKNSAYARFCLRGLVDTDGSVFTHRYRSNGKWYEYKKLDFTTLSPPLLRSAYQILIAHGLHPRISRGKSIRLDSIEDMKRYFKIFKTSNPKHLKRYAR